jgi:hypothetical protein
MGTVDALTFGQMDKIEYFFNLPWNERLGITLLICLIVGIICLIVGIIGALVHFILTKFNKDSQLL